MGKNFSFKYEIFNDELMAIKQMSVDEFEKDFEEVYGNFCLNIRGIEYPFFPSDDSSEEEKGYYSEPILAHLNNYIKSVQTLSNEEFVSIPFTDANNWITIKNIKNNLYISHVIYEGSYLGMNSKVKRGNFTDLEVSFFHFKGELKKVCDKFLRNIELVNREIPKAKCFSILKLFLTKTWD